MGAGLFAAGLIVRDYSDDLAPLFHDINAEWISGMFRLEQTDRDVLENPRARIIEPGGVILFVEAPGLGIIGTCALQKTGDKAFELTKMGVRESARGLKAGAFRWRRRSRARRRWASRRSICSPARNARRRSTFMRKWGSATMRRSWRAMASYGARYARCDVAMRYVG